jgi:hypothetical protein
MIASGSVPEQNPGFERASTWAGVTEGDPVDVLDDRERGAEWRFVAHVTNRSTGAAWVEVVGGRRGDRRRRSFRVDQLYPSRTVRGAVATAAPLNDAPRLPL